MTSNARSLLRLTAIAATLLLAACVTVPAGPSSTALPGTKKTWDQFQADDASCRGYATSLTGSPSDAAAQAGVGSAVAGTIIGAAIGGLLGGGEGAAVGAGMGLFSGSLVGAGNAQVAGSVTQQRYDSAYYQCMYGLGNRVPAPAGYVARNTTARATVPGGRPPPNAAIPPPDTPPPAATPSRTPPPNAAIPPPDTPPPYRLPR
jgi:outer membrane lipoprotein SlyB